MMDDPDMPGLPDANAPMENPSMGNGADAPQPDDISQMDDVEQADEMSQGPEMGNGSEDDDAKKDIQKATGELSQLLNDYGKDDDELKKYVEGMIDSALDNFGSNSENDSEDDAEMEPDAGPEMPMESIRITKGQFKRLNEIFAKDHEEERTEKKKKKISRNNPFNAPKFK